MAKEKGKKEAREEGFEQALLRLEQIVEALEGGDLSLAKGLQAFSEGMRLVKVCEQRLNEARQKVEILVGGKLQPFEAAPDESSESS